MLEHVRSQKKQPFERTLVDVGKNTTLGDGDVAKKLVQLLIVADGELKVTGDDTGLLVVASSVAGKLKNLGSEVLEDGSEVDGSTGANTLGVVALAEETVDTTDGESETSLGRAAVEMQVSTMNRHNGAGLHIGPQNTASKVGDAKNSAQPRANSRLRVLGTAGLAAGLAASSHFDGLVECG